MDEVDVPDTRGLGRRGEALAVAYLERAGYAVLERNYTNSLGELDIVARKEGCLCFIEVKTRRSFKFGMPCEAVHPRKQHKLVRLAESYLLDRFKTVEVLSRFDVISVYQPPDGEAHIEHVRDAFWMHP